MTQLKKIMYIGMSWMLSSAHWMFSSVRLINLRSGTRSPKVSHVAAVGPSTKCTSETIAANAQEHWNGFPWSRITAFSSFRFPGRKSNMFHDTSSIHKFFSDSSLLSIEVRPVFDALRSSNEVNSEIPCKLSARADCPIRSRLMRVGEAISETEIRREQVT